MPSCFKLYFITPIYRILLRKLLKFLIYQQEIKSVICIVYLPSMNRLIISAVDNKCLNIFKKNRILILSDTLPILFVFYKFA